MQVLGQQPGKRFCVGDALQEIFDFLPTVDDTLCNTGIFEECVYFVDKQVQVLDISVKSAFAVFTYGTTQVGHGLNDIFAFAHVPERKGQIIYDFAQFGFVFGVYHSLRNRRRINRTPVFL